MTNSEDSITTVMSVPSSSARSRRPPGSRIVQNFVLVWLDENIDEIHNEDCRNSIQKLRQVVNTVNTFTDVGECIEFIDDITEKKIFMIASGALGQIAVPVMHDNPKLNTIYIFCQNKAWHETWAKNFSKVVGVYTDITSICAALKQAALDCDQNSVSISLVKWTDEAGNQHLDELDQSFMYTQILKEILLTIDFEQNHIDEFLMDCRKQFFGNTIELENMDKFQNEYHRHLPIWWYTYDCFLYSTLNCALRTMEVDSIIKMGFFVQDLHNHLTVLHSEQYAGQNQTASFIVYRGQVLPDTKFEEIAKTKGGLLAFNNFLSTSKVRNVSLDFTRRSMATSKLIGVLFVMKIDPSISSTPFANVRDVSAYQTEEEILFSMHSVFRIGEIQNIDGNDHLWQVDLTLTGDNDQQLNALSERMREETKGLTGWLRLGKLMVKLGQYDEAEDLYKLLIAQPTDDREKGDILYQLGWIKFCQGKYANALTLYKSSLQIREKILTSQHPDVAESYNGIGLAYHKMGEYSKAFSYYEKALEIRQKTLPANHPDLATSYNHIGGVYHDMGEHSKALSYYEKALQIDQKTLPANHPNLANSYGNIGLVYHNMDEHSKALSYCEKALEIRQKTLPANHPDLATSYNRIGGVYHNMDEHSKALSYYEKALQIYQKTLPPNHLDLATSYNNIGNVYYCMGEYLKALSSYERALDIREHSLPPNHPNLINVRKSVEHIQRMANKNFCCVC